MKFAEDFESFLRTEVNLNQNRLDTLQERVTAIESFLEAETTFESMLLDLIPAGSWAHRIIIKPVAENDTFDADVLLHVTEQEDWQAKDYIEKLYQAFHGSGTYTSLAHRHTRCVRIDYAGEFHIDVVPYLEQGGLHYITNRLEPEKTGQFEESNPEAFTVWIDEKQRVTTGSFIKVVRLLKYLRDFKNTFTCKSIILLTLLGDQVNEIEASLNPSLCADVPSTLNTLLRKLADSLPESMPDIMDPAGTGDNFSERYKEGWDYENFRTQIRRYADKVQEAFEETDREASIVKWQAVFGTKFKPGSLAKVASIAPLSAGVPWSGEMFIDRPPLNIPVSLDHSYRVRISSRCMGLNTAQGTRRRGFREFDLPSKGNRVGKHMDLMFKANTNVPGAYELYWKVRNGGEEADNSKQLRGEIRKDEGRNRRREPTLFKGTHYVECYVVKDGVVVAKDHHPVIVT